MKNYSKIFSIGDEGYSYFNHIALSKPNEPLLHNKITKALSKKKKKIRLKSCVFLCCYYNFVFHLKILISTGYVCFNRFIYSIYQFVLSDDILAKFWIKFLKLHTYATRKQIMVIKVMLNLLDPTVCHKVPFLTMCFP